MSFPGYALYKGWDKKTIYLDEIWRVSLSMKDEQIVRYENHYYPVPKSARLSDMIAQNGAENFRFKRNHLTPEFALLPIVIHWEQSFGMYPEAFGL